MTVNGAQRPPRSLLSHIATAVAAAALIIVLGIATLAIVVPVATGSQALTVLTSSMRETLPPGTMVVVRPTDPADIEPGQVITYQLRSGEPEVVTHRVTQVLHNASGELVFITKGDSNAAADPAPVLPVQVRGRVWYSIPYLGYASQVLTGDTRRVIVPVIAIGLFGYAGWMLLSALRDRRRKGNGRRLEQ